MLQRFQQSFSEDHLRLQLREVITKSDAEAQIVMMPVLLARMLVFGAVFLMVAAVIVAQRDSISPHLCAAVLGFSSLALVGAALMVWEYGRIAKLLVRFLQRRDRID